MHNAKLKGAVKKVPKNYKSSQQITNEVVVGFLVSTTASI